MAIDKNAIIKEARKFVEKGQYDKAIAEWKKILSETPDDPTIYNTIGDLCLKNASKSGAVDAYMRAAGLLASDGFTSKAIALYKKVLNIDNTKIEAHLALGDMNAEKGLTGNALENYKQVADHYILHQQTTQALEIYQKMADLNPSNVAFQVKLGDMYAKEGMKEKAAKAYLTAADVHVAKSAFKDARQLFEKVLALEPDNKAVYHKAGIVYFKEGKFAEACKAFKPVFESDPLNVELTELYLEALEKAGKDSEAEQVTRKILAVNPENAGLRQKLYELYLAKKEYDKALVEAATLADGEMKKGNAGAAEELFKTFVTGSPSYPPARQKLAEFYLSVNRASDAAAELLQAADLLVDEGDVESAKAVLSQAVEIVPDLPGARERLERIQPPVVEAPVPEPEPLRKEEPRVAPPAPTVSEPAVMPVPGVPSPAPSAEAPPAQIAEDSAIAEAFNEIEVLVKYGLIPKAIEQLEALCSNFPENTRIRIRLRDLYQGQGNSDKAVRHALLAVALYTKFGREDLAMEALRVTREIAPDHPAVLSRVARMQAAQTAPMVETPEEVPLPEILPDHLEPTPPTTVPSPPALPEAVEPHEPAPTGEIEFEGLDSGAPHLHEPSQPEVAPIPEPAPLEPQPVDQEPPLVEAPIVPEPRAVEQSSPEKPSPGETVEPAAPAMFPVEQEPAPAEAPVVPEPISVEPPVSERNTAIEHEEIAQAPPTAVDIDELWAEAEFFFQQGLFDEAKKHYAQIIINTPGDQRASERLAEISHAEEESREFSELADAVEGLEGYVPSEAVKGEMTPNATDEDAVRTLMEEIRQLKQPLPDSSPRLEEAVIPPQPAPGPSLVQAEAAGKPSETARQFDEDDYFDLGAELQRNAAAPRLAEPSIETRPSEPTQRAVEEDFFDLGAELQRDTGGPAVQKIEDESEDFFDLAAELRDDLNKIPVAARPAGPAEEQSLDDIFEEFKKGVEQQSIKEDADTHYNLGVAYKEMGLLDDAIGEFIMTPEEEPKFVLSRYMLGLCYMEKGEYQNAIGEIQNALDYSETLGIDVQHHKIEMHYDLGLAYQGAGNIKGAISEFQKVSSEERGYRDTIAKLKELSQGGLISLDQLKDDIEREISSKFLEEGERIAHEEKNKKNARVQG